MGFLVSSIKVLILSPGRSGDANSVDQRWDPHTKAITSLGPPGGVCGHDIKAPCPGLPKAEMMPLAILNPPSAFHFNSQQVWVLPSHPDFSPLKIRPTPARTPERQAGVGGSLPQPCQGLPGLRAVMPWMSWGPGAPLRILS